MQVRHWTNFSVYLAGFCGVAGYISILFLDLVDLLKQVLHQPRRATKSTAIVPPTQTAEGT